MHKPHKLVALIWNNCSDVAQFALSRKSALAMRERFEGSWKPLEKVLFEIPKEKADRALLELGTLLRALDDAEDLTDYLTRMGDQSYGFVVMADAGREPLYFRDMTNKILHARGFDWLEDAEFGPVIRCIGNDPKRWKEAQIRLDRLLILCGQLLD